MESLRLEDWTEAAERLGYVRRPTCLGIVRGRRCAACKGFLIGDVDGHTCGLCGRQEACQCPL